MAVIVGVFSDFFIFVSISAEAKTVTQRSRIEPIPFSSGFVSSY